MKKKILVFGGSGLVGRSLVRKLQSLNEFEIHSPTRNEVNLFSYYETKKLLEVLRPDYLINAAAKVGGIVANNTMGTDFLLENLKINMNILEASKDISKTEIINLGSSCIYPLGAKNPISETEFMNGKLEPTNSPYAMAKITAIELGRTISKEYSKKIINLMPTNLYGPNDNFSPLNSHVIPGLIYRMYNAKINKDKKFFIWGSGNPLREFLYVDDLSDSIIFIIKNRIKLDLLNIGSGEEVSIKNLAELVKDTIGYVGDLEFDASKPDGNPKKLLDSSMINNLGWKSKTNLRDGLNLTYKWFLKNFENLRI
jgi:GDP-L-fucose synthase